MAEGRSNPESGRVGPSCALQVYGRLNAHGSSSKGPASLNELWGRGLSARALIRSPPWRADPEAGQGMKGSLAHTPSTYLEHTTSLRQEKTSRHYPDTHTHTHTHTHTFPSSLPPWGPATFSAQELLHGLLRAVILSWDPNDIISKPPAVRPSVSFLGCSIKPFCGVKYPGGREHCGRGGFAPILCPPSAHYLPFSEPALLVAHQHPCVGQSRHPAKQEFQSQNENLWALPPPLEGLPQEVCPPPLAQNPLLSGEHPPPHGAES